VRCEVLVPGIYKVNFSNLPESEWLRLLLTEPSSLSSRLWCNHSSELSPNLGLSTLTLL